MSVTLELPPDVERQVSQAAAERGLTLEAYLLSVIASTGPSLAAGSIEEFEADLDALAQFSDLIPVSPEDAYTREPKVPIDALNRRETGFRAFLEEMVVEDLPPPGDERRYDREELYADDY